MKITLAETLQSFVKAQRPTPVQQRGRDKLPNCDAFRKFVIRHPLVANH
jgi:hypothetical protein